MRLFIAVDLPLEVKKYLSSLKGRFSQKGKIAWVKEENLHVTLKFLGEVDETRTADIIRRLSDIQFVKFSLTLSQLGFFPSENAPQIFWVNFIDPSGLEKISQDLGGNLKEFKNDHPFQDHVTLARIKKLSLEEKNNFLKEAKRIYLEGQSFVVEEFTMYRSILSQEGSKYGAISRFRAQK
ncbi:MAG: RNA 2',3'-cyclic phosphodiesterase [Nanoarchaeota archaeon]|mgnify:CR=1 FL=1